MRFVNAYRLNVKRRAADFRVVIQFGKSVTFHRVFSRNEKAELVEIVVILGSCRKPQRRVPSQIGCDGSIRFRLGNRAYRKSGRFEMHDAVSRHKLVPAVFLCYGVPLGFGAAVVYIFKRRASFKCTVVYHSYHCGNIYFFKSRVIFEHVRFDFRKTIRKHDAFKAGVVLKCSFSDIR